MKVESEVDILVVLKDTLELNKRNWVINNSYSKTISKQMTIYARDNSMWKFVGEIPTQKYDTLIVYFKNN